MTRQCAVTGCGRPVRSRGWCATHYRRWQRHGDPQAERSIAQRNHNGTSYTAVHRFLRRELGPANAALCADCGSGAVCWSYDGTDPSELTDPRRGVRYSLAPERYRARCRSCHRRLAPRRGRPSLEPHRAVRAVRLYLAGATVAGIAALLGASPSAIRGALRAAGVRTRAPGRPPRTQRPADTPN